MMLMVFRLSTPGSSPPSQARLDRRCVRAMALHYLAYFFCPGVKTRCGMDNLFRRENVHGVKQAVCCSA
ncbi:hypothetical protein FOXYSP1_15508 [Fusarium oxysporum f. sp. phaseoli]